MEFNDIACGTIDIVGNNGKLYKIGALNFKDLADFSFFIQFLEYHNAVKLSKDLSPEDRRKFLKDTFNECCNNSVSVLSPKFIKSFFDPICMSKFLEIAFKKFNQGFDENDLEQILDFRYRDDIDKVIEIALGFTSKGELMGQLIEEMKI